jgi:CubicO group peptidase (beta-lactamase class C family)
VRNYSRQESFAAQLRAEPRRACRPVELVDQAATHGTPQFAPGEGFEYSDTGYAIAGILVEQATGRQLHEVYREQVDPATVPTGFLAAHNKVEGIRISALARAVKHHKADVLI